MARDIPLCIHLTLDLQPEDLDKVNLYVQRLKEKGFNLDKDRDSFDVKNPIFPFDTRYEPLCNITGELCIIAEPVAILSNPNRRCYEPLPMILATKDRMDYCQERGPHFKGICESLEDFLLRLIINPNF